MDNKKLIKKVKELPNYYNLLKGYFTKEEFNRLDIIYCTEGEAKYDRYFKRLESKYLPNLIKDLSIQGA